MLDQLTPFITSPWIYLIVFAVVAVDAFFPAVPSETVVIGAAVVAATGEPHIAGLLAAATTGAFAGDSVSYALGRYALGTPRLLRTPRIRTAHAQARRALARRGGTALVAARFIPGGRTATTLVAGTVRYPIRRYWLFTAVAAAAWAGYATALGYVGGELFNRRPLAGLAAGLLLACGLTLTIEIGRRLLRRHPRRAPAPAVRPPLPPATARDGDPAVPTTRPRPDPDNRPMPPTVRATPHAHPTTRSQTTDRVGQDR